MQREIDDGRRTAIGVGGVKGKAGSAIQFPFQPLVQNAISVPLVIVVVVTFVIGVIIVVVVIVVIIVALMVIGI